MIFNDMLLSGGLVTGEIIVTITGRNTTIEYDGQSHSVSSYNVSFSDPAYTINDFSFSGTATASGTNVGEYAMGLEAAQFTNTNPKFKSVTFVVTDGYVRITGRRVTVTAEAKSKTYDNDSSTDPALTATVSGTLGTDTVTYSVSRTSGENAGEYTITPSGDITQGNYLVQYVAAKFTINRKPVTVKGDDASKTYGDSDPVFTATATGLIGTDTVVYTVSRAAGNNVGTYAITPTGQATQGNYTVTYQAGTFTINRKAVIVKANDASKTYGASDPTFTATVTGTLGSDTVSYTFTRASGSNVGTYVITPTGQVNQGNYSVTYQTGILTINRKAITVKADNKSKQWGDEDPALTWTATGLVGSDRVYVTSITRAAGENRNNYVITVSGESVQGNYTVTYQTGTFTITYRSATVTANNATKVEGDSDPYFDATVEGTLGSDSLSYSLTRRSGETPGTYAITPSGNAIQGNYSVSYVSGYLVITARPTTGSIQVFFTFQTSAELKINYDPFVEDINVFHRTVSSGYTVSRLQPGTYSVSNETQGLWNIVTVTAGSTTQVTL